MFGPTTGDRTRPADPDLWREVDKDQTTYGAGVQLGVGKMRRHVMVKRHRAGTLRLGARITNAAAVARLCIV